MQIDDKPCKIDFDVFGKLFCIGITKEGIADFFGCTTYDIDVWCKNTIKESFEELCKEADYAVNINQDKQRPYTVYMHICPNGKKYIGVTKCKLNKRFGKGRGYESNIHFASAINKYGWENIEHAILFMRLTREEAEQKEIEMIKRFRSCDRRYGYNIESGGMLNKEVSDETREKLRKASSGKHPTAETRKKMSESHSGTKCHFYGTTVSEEDKQKLRELRSKKVIKMDHDGNIIAEYPSMKEAAKAHGVTRQAISSCCSGKSKNCLGYLWRWKQ